MEKLKMKRRRWKEGERMYCKNEERWEGRDHIGKKSLG